MMRQSMVHLGRLLILLLPVAILLTDGASILGQKALADEAIYSNEAEIKPFNEYPVEDIEEDYDSYAQDVPVSNLEDQDEEKYDNEVEQANKQGEEKDNYEENPVPIRERTDGTGKDDDDDNDDPSKKKGSKNSPSQNSPNSPKPKKKKGKKDPFHNMPSLNLNDPNGGLQVTPRRARSGGNPNLKVYHHHMSHGTAAIPVGGGGVNLHPMAPATFALNPLAPVASNTIPANIAPINQNAPNDQSSGSNKESKKKKSTQNEDNGDQGKKGKKKKKGNGDHLKDSKRD